jgi:hypothetical protein
VLEKTGLQANGQPIWTGNVYESAGPRFGQPFNPAYVSQWTVGTATFAPLSMTKATLTYSIDSTTVTKAIQREAFNHTLLDGGYEGGYVIDTSSCSSAPAGKTGIIQMALSGSTDTGGFTGSIQTALNFDSTGQCALSGTFEQFGTVYSVANSGSCTTPAKFASLTANLTDLVSTTQGLEGEISLTGSGCSAHVSYGTVKVF